MQKPGRYRILLVDDEAELADSIATYVRLRLDEVEVDIADSGNEAVLRLQEKGPYDLVLSDVRMAKGDGLFLLNSLSSLAPGTRPIFYFLTGYSEADKQTLLQKGADGVLEKPISLKELTKILEDALAARKVA